MDGVEYVYCLNLTRCIGCRKCVHACVAENNQSRDPEIQYIRVLKLPDGSLGVDKADHFYAPNPCRKRVTSTCRCSASNASILRASRFARSMPPAGNRRDHRY